MTDRELLGDLLVKRGIAWELIYGGIWINAAGSSDEEHVFFEFDKKEKLLDVRWQAGNEVFADKLEIKDA